ncbi:AI-2E family transporter [Gilvimarinus polysaccharolyticus]|uniref:AI-2E family transporter n=1 Tax=Gilvimarinus polysaccharolyticus TaxID=863921 RepID=UPI0009FFB4BA|nr:AI-2E family transporter [Gilvimarinus polysaccharolyticus]
MSTSSKLPAATEEFNTSVVANSVRLALKSLSVLAILYTLYFSQTLLIPIFVAAFIALFSSPIVRLLGAIYIPKPAAALLVIGALIGGLGYLFSLLVAPATRWLQVLPTLADKIANEMGEMGESFSAIKKSVMSGSTNDGDSIEKAVDSTLHSVVSVLAETTAAFAVQVGAVVVITYFFLVFGEELMRHVVKARRTFSAKKSTVVVFQAVQTDISHYVLVISLINVGLGLATAGAMYLLGVEDALLWGALATLLNFAPYVGPMLLVIILTGVGFMEFTNWTSVVLVPGAFLLLNFIECQLVTPTLLGRRFNMNPLLVVLWMFAWGWLWGAVGMLIAIPLLVFSRILASHLDLMGAWVGVLDGGYDEPSSNGQSTSACAPAVSSTAESEPVES